MDDAAVHKRQRMSPSLTPNIDEEDDEMDVLSAGRESRAASDASSDWGDWADRLEQGETSGDAAVEAAGDDSAVDSSGKDEEDDPWVREQMEQPSAVLGVDNRAWDYVLQQIVLDEGEVGDAAEDSGCTVVDLFPSHIPRSRDLRREFASIHTCTTHCSHFQIWK